MTTNYQTDATAAARYAGIPSTTVRRWLRRGAVPGAVKQGRTWVLDYQAVEELRRLAEARARIRGQA